MTRKESYKNIKTGEIREFDADVDENGYVPMFQFVNEEEWTAISKFKLALVNSTEFFASAHENRVRFKKDPLDGSDAPYGLT